MGGTKLGLAGTPFRPSRSCPLGQAKRGEHPVLLVRAPQLRLLSRASRIRRMKTAVFAATLALAAVAASARLVRAACCEGGGGRGKSRLRLSRPALGPAANDASPAPTRWSSLSPFSQQHQSPVELSAEQVRARPSHRPGLLRAAASRRCSVL